jgi:hypothetical protein
MSNNSAMVGCAMSKIAHICAPWKDPVEFFLFCDIGGFHRLVYTKGHVTGTPLLLQRDKKFEMALDTP